MAHGFIPYSQAMGTMLQVWPTNLASLRRNSILENMLKWDINNCHGEALARARDYKDRQAKMAGADGGSRVGGK